MIALFALIGFLTVFGFAMVGFIEMCSAYDARVRRGGRR